MFSWLSTEGLPHGERPDRYYSKARFVLDSFYSLYCPELADEIDELCVAIDSQTYTVDHVLTKLCERFQHKGPLVHDWTGEFVCVPLFLPFVSLLPLFTHASTHPRHSLRQWSSTASTAST